MNSAKIIVFTDLVKCVTKIFICCECNLPAIANPETNTYECKKCNNYKKFKKINIPYSCKLLMQELQCMSIGPRFITE